MSIQMITSQPTLMQCVQKNGKLECEPVEKQDSNPGLAKDSLEIKKGLKPTLIGGGLGVVAGAGGGVVAAIALDKALNLGSGALALLALPVVGAPSAALAGAVTANITDHKGKGALIGAAVGALTGGVATVLTGSSRFILSGMAVGAAFGAAGGLTGSFIAERK